jgi:hypothetical protein
MYQPAVQHYKISLFLDLPLVATTHPVASSTLEASAIQTRSGAVVPLAAESLRLLVPVSTIEQRQMVREMGRSIWHRFAQQEARRGVGAVELSVSVGRTPTEWRRSSSWRGGAQDRG